MNHRPVIPWIGGKTRLAEHILPKFPDHSCYVEAFCGAAAMFFMKRPSDVEVLNDVNGDLVNLYRVIQNHLEEFVRQFKWALSSRQVYEWEQQKVPDTLTDIQRAARFYYLQKQAFGGLVDGQNYGTATTSRPRLNILRIEEDLSQAWHRLQGVYVENLPWDQVVARYDREHTLHYLDPPYWGTAGYGVDFEFEHYEKMAQMAREVDGSMLISINDDPDIRRAFDGLHMQEIEIRYTVGGGGGSEAKELLIWNDNCEERKIEMGTMEMFDFTHGN